MWVPKAIIATSVESDIGACESYDVNCIRSTTTNLAIMDWGKVGLRLTVTAPNVQWVGIVVSLVLWDLRIEGCYVHLLTLHGGVTSETRRVQT